MPTLERICVSQNRITSTQKKEQIQASDVMKIPGKLDVTTEFLTIPNLLKGAKLESDSDLDEDWLFQRILQPGYHWVHIIMTDAEWKKLKLRSSLYGQMNMVARQIITYARHHEKSKYQNSHHYSDPFDDLPEAAIATFHEGLHGFESLFDIEDPKGNDIALCHSYMYGYDMIYTKEQEKRLKPKRWVKKPQPLAAWRSLPWSQLPSRSDNLRARLKEYEEIVKRLKELQKI